MRYWFSYLRFLLNNYPVRIRRLGRHLGIISLSDHYYIRSKSLRDWLATISFYVFDLLLLPDLYEWIMGIIKPNTRLLTVEEIEIAQSIYDDLLDWNLVRIDDQAIIATRRLNIAYVSMYTINSHVKVSDSLLVHELAHVLQYSRFGSVYIYYALKAQASSEGYDYGGFEGLLYAKQIDQSIFDFNLEQQASIIEDYYCLRKENHLFVERQKIYLYFVDQIKTATQLDHRLSERPSSNL